MIKGAVFDMDGLMFDSERFVYEIWQSMLDEIGSSIILIFIKILSDFVLIIPKSITKVFTARILTMQL